MSENFDLGRLRYQIETEQRWRDEVAAIPYLKFPSDWEIRIIPPFGDAVVRFQVRLPSGETRSVYLDSRDSLGCVGKPYWEVYPYGDDVGRCDRDDPDTLLKMIATPNPAESSKNV